MIVAQEVAITTTITDINGDPANPTQVTFKVKKPNGTIDIYDLTSTNVQTITAGYVYRCIIDTPLTGLYKCRFEATNSVGNVVGVDEQTFYVRPSSL